MSISDLFNKKIVTQSSLSSLTSSVESPELIKQVNIKNRKFFPNVNFGDPNQFVHFGSAKEYYEGSIKRIYEQYPYDGSEAEKLEFENNSTYLDNWLFKNKYPKATGFANFGLGSKDSANNGYALFSTPEYVFSAGGLHSASLNQHTTEQPIENYSLKNIFDLGVKYDADKNRTINYRLNFTEGVTIQFFLKKAAFDASIGDKEVVLDLWNGIASGSTDLGRLTLELDRTSADSCLNLTLVSGVHGFNRQQISTVSAASFANSTWTHHTITMKTSGNNLEVRYFKDGLLNKNTSFVIGTALGEISGKINGYIGALQTTAYGGGGGQYHGQLSASIDEFRFWKTKLDDQYIYNTWYHPVGGGANTDDFRTNLGVYYKFNEGITGTDGLDSIVLDYSGRIANGVWNGYVNGSSRSDGSAFSETEEGDPIIRSDHPQIVSLLSEMELSGSEFDRGNSSNLYDTLPIWLREEDEKNNNIKYLYQILSSYLDTLYVQIQELPNLKNKNYFSASADPYFFMDRILNDAGLLTPNSFVNADVLEYFWERNNSGDHYEQSIEKTKRIIYNNIYNNLEYIYKTKGTEKSFRNLLRCYGIDDELVKLNVYTDNGKHYIRDRYKNSSVKTKVLNLNAGNRLQGTVFQTTSSNNTLSYIPASGDGARLERYSAFSMEAGIIFPKKESFGEETYFSFTSVSSSMFGFHEAATGSTDHYSFAEENIASVQVYAVRQDIDSSKVKFVVKSPNSSFVAGETDFFEQVYSTSRWNFQLTIKPEGYPNFGQFAEEDPKYKFRLYGVTHTLGAIQQEFTLTGSIPTGIGRAILCRPKRVFIGANRLNFTGSVINDSDLVFDSCRVWMDELSDIAIQQHNLDPMNYGSNKIATETTVFNPLLEAGTEIPGSDSLILHWNFDQNSSANDGGEFTVEDFSSGSFHLDKNKRQYGWAPRTLTSENKGFGFGFEANDPNPVTTQFIFARRKELPEISYTDDNITIMDQKQEYFIEDDDTTDNVFALEKSMYQTISEEMLRTFSTMKEYSNMFARPVDSYRYEYKGLRLARNLFFEKVSDNPDLDRYTDYFKWIDSSLSFFIEQLKPASVTFTKGISNVVESHVFERPKYDRKFPTVKKVTATQGIVRSVGELTYNWKFGHAPLQTTATATIVISDSGGITNGDTFVLIDSNGVSTTYTINGGVAPASGGGNGGSATVGFSGIGGGSAGKVAAAAAMVIAINATTDANYTAVSDGVDTVRITQGDPGSNGNRINTDSISSTTVSNFTGGATRENQHCLWQRERAERTGALSGSRNTIRDRSTFETLDYNIRLGDNDRRIYLKSSYTTRRWSKPYKLSSELNSTIHGGINYNQNKNRDFVFDVTRPHGHKTNLGVPVNVFVVGVGPGQGIENTRVCEDIEGPNQKTEFNFTMIAGKDSSGDGSSPASASLDYIFRTKGHFAAPFNLLSGSVTAGANKAVAERYKSNAIITNLHSDTTYLENDIPMQSPFTETWVGGHQARHVEINRYDIGKKSEGGVATQNNIDDQYSRPEAWRLLLGEHPDEASQDGAFGFVGPDYGGPYPDPSRRWAIYYRDYRVKRPYNFRNISGSEYRLGNYVEEYEYINMVGRLENNSRLKKAASIENYQISGSFLPTSIQSTLPATTNPVTLIAQAAVASATGNSFGVYPNNRQPLTLNLERESDFLTGTTRNRTVIASRFSAPGGIEVQGYAFLDAYAREYSVYNSLNYRNLSVRGSGSGENGTIRANIHNSSRDGLRTLYQRHMGNGGIDSSTGQITSADYTHVPSFHKIPRNTLVTPRSGSEAAVIVERHNNYNFSSIIPASDYNYSWVTSSLGDNYSVRSGTQKVFGYWPKDGLNTVNNVQVSAITFPTSSQIYGE